MHRSVPIAVGLCLCGMSNLWADDPVVAPKPVRWQPVTVTDAVVVAEQPASNLLNSRRLDALIVGETGAVARSDNSLVSDEHFLRRVTLDLIGRQPTPVEMTAFLQEESGGKRSRVVVDLLANDEFGRNWANYWSDTIGYRVPPPELTFLNYGPLKQWLAEQFNDDVRWDQTVRAMLTGSGRVKDNPQATFVAYHQGNAVKLASETARIFLGLQLQCAQCHDHPFDDWNREQFHHLAAFFARTKVEMPWNDGSATVVSAKPKGEYKMPNADDPLKKGTNMLPVFLTGAVANEAKVDDERRRKLADYVTAVENRWFSRAYVNRVWAHMMGLGFVEPVDDLSEKRTQRLPNTHESLTDHFVQSKFDVKALFYLIANTEAYQRQLASSDDSSDAAYASASTKKMRGDEVFDSLVTAIRLPNIRGQQVEPTEAIRFPPPPKSTQDVVTETFGFDPSLSPIDVSRNMNQAMLLMNNRELDAQIDAAPDSGTVLSELLQREPGNRKAVQKLFRLLMAREPTNEEVEISLEHIRTQSDRGEAFEDLLWSLINSTEFTTKR